jgi:uncharacterized protein DUF4886
MKILFIGNSYTHYNDLPGMLQDLSETSGKTLETAMVTSGGKSLEWHWYNPVTLDTIAEGQWDFVVLQDHSLSAVEEPDRLRSAMIKLATRIRNVNATPVLYLTWGRQHIPEMQDVIAETYMRVAREIDAKVAPVGLAWQKVRAAAPGLSLYVTDRSHPSFLGSYLAACVFYATLFGETPVDLSNEFRLCDGVAGVVDKDQAVLLQEIAWVSVQELKKNTPGNGTVKNNMTKYEKNKK